MLPVLVVQPDASDPPGLLGDWLPAAGLELDVQVLDAGDVLPDDLSRHAGVIVLGGAGSAGDAEFAPVRELLRRAVSGEVPTLGICLGHQLLAAAHGGVVRRMPDGPEIGAQLVAKRAAAASDPLFGELPITPDVTQWHRDEVGELPPGAVLLAASPVSANQAFRLGRLAWGVQFHPEATLDIVRGWAHPRGWDIERVYERLAAVQDDLAEVWAPFAARFAAVVRDPDSVAPPAGVRTSTASPVTDPAAIRAALAAEAGAARLPFPTRRDDHD